jgi:hypothetical protein
MLIPIRRIADRGDLSSLVKTVHAKIKEKFRYGPTLRHEEADLHCDDIAEV